MSTPLKNWKSPAYQALAEYYKVEAERANFEERLDAARQAAERAGVSFRYGTPTVDSTPEAYLCSCGTVMPRGYSDPIREYCVECVAKTAAAVEADAKLEGRPVPPAPVKEGAPF
jgi:hypothetical protein